MRAAGRRLTPQRRLILQVLEESHGHLDADALYARVKARDADVSLATVYRTLAVLREIWLVEEHRLGQDNGNYESVRQKPHYHFTCLRCGKVFEVDSDAFAEAALQAGAAYDFEFTSTQVELTGYCASCSQE